MVCILWCSFSLLITEHRAYHTGLQRGIGVFKMKKKANKENNGV